MYSEKRKIQKLVSWLLMISLIAGCMKLPNVSAAAKKSNRMYYFTSLNPRIGRRSSSYSNSSYYYPGTTKVTWKGNTLIMYASFSRCRDGRMTTARFKNKKYFVKYGRHTFRLTNKTKFFYMYPEGPKYVKKIPFLKSLCYLDLWIVVENGKVTSMSLYS